MNKPVAVLHIEESDNPAFGNPDLLIRDFRPALEAMDHSHQKMSVELQLPAYLWIMLADIASSNRSTVEREISNRLFADPTIRAEWIATDSWENELWPEVERHLTEARETKKAKAEVERRVAEAREAKGGAR